MLNSAEGEVPLNVNYYNAANGESINHQIADIMKASSCKYAVTRVNYVVTVANTDIVYVTANIFLKDITSSASPVTASYSVEYTYSAQQSVPKVNANRGYSFQEIVSGIGIPKHDVCNSAVNVESIQFGVSRIAQCYKIINDIEDCPKLYSDINTTMFGYLNLSKITSNPGGTTPILPIEISQLNMTSLLNTTPDNNSTHISNLDPLYCDYLPLRLHISIYTVNNSVSGKNITNVTYYFEHSGLNRDSLNMTSLFVTVRYLELDNILRKQCSYCIDSLLNVLVENQVTLLNSLTLICLAAFYCFLSPQNIFKSHL